MVCNFHIKILFQVDLLPEKLQIKLVDDVTSNKTKMKNQILASDVYLRTLTWVKPLRAFSPFVLHTSYKFFFCGI